MMEQMALKDYKQYQDAAEDNDIGGGVNLSGLLDSGDGSSNGAPLMKALIPQSVSSASMPVEQQKWPTLQAAGKNNTSAASPPLVQSIKKLAIQHNTLAMVLKQPTSLMDDDDGMVPMPWLEPQSKQVKETDTPWPLPADSKEADPLPLVSPAAWSTGAASKELFKGAKLTPPPADWEARLREKEENDHKSNLLHHQFWNPSHEDYDEKRFYDPMIEKYKCPFPGCE
jgi:hypothetical protein